ncbi:hypothetical protein H8L32_25085 [Undibacterium sp. CY18W]|uniref:Uncharacterized protein n=1 Tax=Undibacterium hunanense TaxID=2762292 RepID=A0ABR6ZY24_9BURK|nr:Imm41 family immunity protein [Undibacterium hunanense]MBC3920765.1 hypothetical protein [Undibacterium hunanense]
MFENISRNLPGNANWKGSFYEQLTECGIWDKHAFWMLHKDLVLAADKLKNLSSVDKELASAIVRLQSNVDRLFAAHFNKNDVFKIVNLSTDDMYALKERFDMAVIGVFSGAVPPEDAVELP